MTEKPDEANSTDGRNPKGGGEFPTAKVVASRWRFLEGAGFMWALAIVCVVAVIFLMARAYVPTGPSIQISFEHGYGLEPGDPLRLRGINVGEVTSVAMADGLEQVDVVVALAPEAKGLARERSRFWIERPQVRLGAISGLDTLMGPKYIAVQPGEGPPQFQFQGSPSPRQFSDGDSVGVTIRFRQGFGIKAGAAVRFRGMDVGEVVDVELEEGMTFVLVHAELHRSASRLAQTGARFWIERAEVSMAEVRGLDTLLGGAYVAATPASEVGDPAFLFEGLDAAPAGDQSNGGVEVILETSSRRGLKSGSPVLHRGVSIGKIVRVGLASDGASVEARAIVEPAFRDLVRSNSKFWNSSGLGVEIGLWKGVQLDAESLETVAAGGVAVATPDPPGDKIVTGHRFTLEEKAAPSWEAWRPQIAIGRSLLPDNVDVPLPIRATLRWQRRRFGFLRNQQSDCWANRLEGGGLLCPWDGELPEQLTIEFEGKSESIGKDKFGVYGGSLILCDEVKASLADGWTTERVRQPSQPENCVLLAGPDSLPVSAGRLTSNDSGWDIDAATELTADWNGASVVSQANGDLIGILIWNDGRPFIAPLQPPSQP